jgi:hypothetical protein
MSRKGAHINVLGHRIRRYYEHLMGDAQAFINELQKDLEWPLGDRGPGGRTAMSSPGAGDRLPTPSPRLPPQRTHKR